MRLNIPSAAHVRRAIETHLLPDQPLRLLRHPQFGRNHIYIGEIKGQARFFVKVQDPRAATEALACQLLGENGIGLPVCLLLPASGLAIFDYIDPLPTLEKMACEAPTGALLALVMLAPHVAKLEMTPVPQWMRARQDQFDFPVPQIEQILDISEGAAEFLRMLQSSGLTDQLNSHCGDVPVFSHGDIKLDNIVVVSGKPHLIDWEAAGLAAPGSDCAALAAMALLTVIRFQPSMATDQSVDLEAGFAAAAMIMRSYLANSDNVAVDAEQFGKLTAMFLVRRTLSECMFKHRPDPKDWLLFDIAQHVVKNGFENRGD